MRLFQKRSNRRLRQSSSGLIQTGEVCENRLLLTGGVVSEIGLDIDQDSEADAMTDGVLVLRWLAGFTDETLVSGATDASGTRLAPGEIDAYISARLNDFDIDQNGQIDPLSDGILIMRYLAGFTGDQLTDGVIDAAEGERINTGLVSGHLGWLGRDLPPVPSFNDDDFADIVGINDDELWLAASNGSTFTSTVWGEWDSDVDWLNVNVGDFNGDGLQDFAGRDETGDWQVGLSDGAQFETADWGNWSPDTIWEDVTTADVNGDRRTDIVGHSNGDWSVALSTGSGFSTQNWGNWQAGQRWHDVSAGDINGDGKDDVIGRLDDGTWWSAVADNDQFHMQTWVTWPEDADFENLRTGDFNGDQRMDVIRLNDGALHVGLTASNGAGSIPQEWGRRPTTAEWEDVKVLDVNGDGRDDVAARIDEQWWTGISTGDAFVMEPWGPSVSSASPAAASPAADWHDVTVGDVNGDGRDDLVGRVDGQWTAAVSKGSSFEFQEFGEWERDAWSHVQSSQSDGTDSVRNQSATGFAPGVVTREINSALLGLIDELREELVELDSDAEDLVDLTQTLEDLQTMRQSIQENQDLIQPVIDGTVNSVQLGPEAEVTRVTLAESDRLIWDFMLDATGQPSSSGRLETVDDVQNLAESFYSQLVDDTISGSREAVGKLSDILSSVSGPLSPLVQGVTAMTLAGISAALESGKVIINDGHATADSYAQTTDILLEYVNGATSLQEQVTDEISDALDSVYWEILNVAISLANQFDTSQPGSAGNQIRTNFQQIQVKTGVSSSQSILGTWTGEHGSRGGTITLLISTDGAYLQSGGTLRGSGRTNSSTSPGDTSLTATFTGYFTYHRCNCSLDPNPANEVGLSVELNSSGELVGSFDAGPVRLRRG